MHFTLQTSFPLLCLLGTAYTRPTSIDLSDQSGPQPGQSSYYSTYAGTTDSYPANETTTIILPTTTGPPGPDDLLFQNLLAAEWVIYSFYQQGVETFNTSSFTSMGYPNTTFARLLEIRDNEAGHLKIFQQKISNTSIKPGRCEYDFGFSSVESYLTTLTTLEISSMAFLTGLIQEANLNASKAALVAIAETESRHNTWSLIDIWNTNPFAGPSDTAFPYANQILDITNLFVIAGSCPAENPPYPTLNQKLPTLSYNATTTPGPGDEIIFSFPNSVDQPIFEEGGEYWAVFFHGLFNISVPFDVGTNTSKVPENIEGGKGIILVVLADEIGAPSLESVVAGPLILSEQSGVGATAV